MAGESQEHVLGIRRGQPEGHRWVQDHGGQSDQEIGGPAFGHIYSRALRPSTWRALFVDEQIIRSLRFRVVSRIT